MADSHSQGTRRGSTTRRVRTGPAATSGSLDDHSTTDQAEDTPMTDHIDTTETNDTSQPGVSGERGVGSEASGSSVPQGIATQIREKATSQVSAQKERLADTLSAGLRAVKQTTEQLREQDQATIAGYVDRGVSQAEAWVEDLRQRDAADIIRAVQEFGRRQPALLIAGSFALGVLAARFLKSSAQSLDADRMSAGAYHSDTM